MSTTVDSNQLKEVFFKVRIQVNTVQKCFYIVNASHQLGVSVFVLLKKVLRVSGARKCTVIDLRINKNLLYCVFFQMTRAQQKSC